MRLIDSITQYRTPFIVSNLHSRSVLQLNCTAECADSVASCALRYVLSDDLIRLCVDLAHSKGADAVACADLLHAPAEGVWVEWNTAPWQSALQRNGLETVPPGEIWAGRRGTWVRATRDGRRGLVRTFWSDGGEDVLASSVEAYFDFDTATGDEPEPVDGKDEANGKVYDDKRSDDILGRCFRFRYEKSWLDYYRSFEPSDELRKALWQNALGTIAPDIPTLLAFFLLLATRNGLPQRAQRFERLNLRRRRNGKPPLLDHIEVRAPMLPQYHEYNGENLPSARHGPRLHHVRGHLVRRGGKLFWRVPHLRGNIRSGAMRKRTVVWTFADSDHLRHGDTSPTQA
jgi:hypothetical protein